MARYIDAVELIKAIEENQRSTEHHKDGRGKQIHVSEHRHFIKMIYEQPTADVQEVRHGKWIPSKVEAIKTTFICSECNREVDMTNDYFGKPSIHVGKQYPYCHCGALMDGKE